MMVPEASVTTFEPVRWSVRMYETVEEAPEPTALMTRTTSRLIVYIFEVLYLN